MKKSFSIIELIIVLSIMLIISGLLYPVTCSFQQKQYAKQCVSNLHSFSSSLVSYLSDYDLTYPKNNWYDCLKKYSKKDLKCPSSRVLPNYAWNNMLSPIGNVVSIYNIRDPYNIICISDSFNSQYFGVPIGTQFVSRNGFVDIISSNYYNYSLNCLLDACRHNGGLNCLFIDGSVRFVNKQSIEYSIVYWDIGK